MSKAKARAAAIRENEAFRAEAEKRASVVREQFRAELEAVAQRGFKVVRGTIRISASHLRGESDYSTQGRWIDGGCVGMADSAIYLLTGESLGDSCGRVPLKCGVSLAGALDLVGAWFSEQLAKLPPITTRDDTTEEHRELVLSMKSKVETHHAVPTEVFRAKKSRAAESRRQSRAADAVTAIATMPTTAPDPAPFPSCEPIRRSKAEALARLKPFSGRDPHKPAMHGVWWMNGLAYATNGKAVAIVPINDDGYGVHGVEEPQCDDDPVVRLIHAIEEFVASPSGDRVETVDSGRLMACVMALEEVLIAHGADSPFALIRVEGGRLILTASYEDAQGAHRVDLDIGPSIGEPRPFTAIGVETGLHLKPAKGALKGATGPVRVCWHSMMRAPAITIERADGERHLIAAAMDVDVISCATSISKMSNRSDGAGS